MRCSLDRTPSLSARSARQTHGLKSNLTSAEIISRTLNKDGIISGGICDGQPMPFMSAGQSGPFKPHPETQASSQSLSQLLSPSPTLSPSPAPSSPFSTRMAPMIFERKLNAWPIPQLALTGSRPQTQSERPSRCSDPQQTSQKLPHAFARNRQEACSCRTFPRKGVWACTWEEWIRVVTDDLSPSACCHRGAKWRDRVQSRQ